ncbi:MAG: CTP synthase [Candidatus Colwellbacteria bacterium]|nr:CTP synthase [Candidatus Colwellbacteria bacterium]
MSGVGKGIAVASIGRLLQAHGIKATAIKIDPYINVDAGTMNPTEHGEVFVLRDGLECDQDMGNYERFLGTDLSGANYMTTGSVYRKIINDERNMRYKGKCVEVVPHVPLEVISRIKHAAKVNKAEVVLIEIGGTIGEYQNVLFLEAIRILRLKESDSVFLALVSYLPLQGDGNELKTKPTQYAIKSLNAAGLHPDMVFARAKTPLDKKRKEKIAFNCSISVENVISAPDVESIYDIPNNFKRENVDKIILESLGLKSRGFRFKDWAHAARRAHSAKHRVKIGIVGKYFSTGSFMLADSYISVIESIRHASYSLNLKPEIVWLNADDYVGARNLNDLKKFDGIIVPGGFGGRGIEGKIAAIKFCRENKIPYFGLCYGMQLAAVEIARHVAKLKGAHTVEINPHTKYPIIDVMPDQKEKLANHDYGGTMRLGSYTARISKGTIAEKAYEKHTISERHRHRYEVNPKFIAKLEKAGAVFSGKSPDGKLMEIMELPRTKHPFFLGTQFHPEFQSSLLSPHPLFVEFIRASAEK